MYGEQSFHSLEDVVSQAKCKSTGRNKATVSLFVRSDYTAGNFVPDHPHPMGNTGEPLP